ASITVVTASVTTKYHPPLRYVRQVSDCATYRGRNRTDQDVAITNMPQLMREHTFQFFIVEQIQNSMRDGNRSMLRIPSSRKGIGRIRRNHIELRHRQSNFLRQPFHNAV